MLSFFHKISQKLLSQNRVTRYLAYVIREIYLVVIGILIAENLSPTPKGGFYIFEL